MCLCYHAVLEYVEGNTISNMCRTQGKIDETTVRSYLKDIIAGVIYLHGHVSSSWVGPIAHSGGAFCSLVYVTG